MTVCINAYASFCDIFSSSVTDLSQADFVKRTAYLIHYWHLLTNRAVARFQKQTRQVSSAEGASRKGGLGACPPQKILKFRGSELLF